MYKTSIKDNYKIYKSAPDRKFPKFSRSDRKRVTFFLYHSAALHSYLLLDLEDQSSSSSSRLSYSSISSSEQLWPSAQAHSLPQTEQHSSAHCRGGGGRSFSRTPVGTIGEALGVSTSSATRHLVIGVCFGIMGGASSSPIQLISCKRTSLIENDCNLGPQTLCALYYACCALVIFPNAKQQKYICNTHGHVRGFIN